jgi:hypothetical protein
LNPSSDVSPPIPGSILKAINIPLDVYVIVVDAFGGMSRDDEAPEIARVASPCSLKFESGSSEGEIYMPWMIQTWHQKLIREKVTIASIVLEIIERHAPRLNISDRRPEDLVLAGI